MAIRSPGAGWTIIATSTPSNAPRSAMIALPPPPSSAGVPSTTTRPPSSSARAARARPAPRPALPMMLCPQAWPIPGSASYSHRTATVGPEVPARATKAVSRPKAPRSTSRPSAFEHVGQQVVGELLLEAELGAGVDLVRHVEQDLLSSIDLVGELLFGRVSVHGPSVLSRPATLWARRRRRTQPSPGAATAGRAGAARPATGRCRRSPRRRRCRRPEDRPGACRHSRCGSSPAG